MKLFVIIVGAILLSAAAIGLAYTLLHFYFAP